MLMKIIDSQHATGRLHKVLEVPTIGERRRKDNGLFSSCCIRVIYNCPMRQLVASPLSLLNVRLYGRIALHRVFVLHSQFNERINELKLRIQMDCRVVERRHDSQIVIALVTAKDHIQVEQLFLYLLPTSDRATEGQQEFLDRPLVMAALLWRVGGARHVA